MLRAQKPVFRSINMVFATLLIFSLLFCALFYSFSTGDLKLSDYMLPERHWHDVDIKQTIFFALVIVFAIYSFGLSLIKDHNHTEYFDIDDDQYNVTDDAKRNNLSNQANETTEPKTTSNEELGRIKT